MVVRIRPLYDLTAFFLVFLLLASGPSSLVRGEVVPVGTSSSGPQIHANAGVLTDTMSCTAIASGATGTSTAVSVAAGDYAYITIAMNGATVSAIYYAAGTYHGTPFLVRAINAISSGQFAEYYAPNLNAAEAFTVTVNISLSTSFTISVLTIKNVQGVDSMDGSSFNTNGEHVQANATMNRTSDIIVMGTMEEGASGTPSALSHRLQGCAWYSTTEDSDTVVRYANFSAQILLWENFSGGGWQSFAMVFYGAGAGGHYAWVCHESSAIASSCDKHGGISLSSGDLLVIGVMFTTFNSISTVGVMYNNSAEHLVYNTTTGSTNTLAPQCNPSNPSGSYNYYFVLAGQPATSFFSVVVNDSGNNLEPTYITATDITNATAIDRCGSGNSRSSTALAWDQVARMQAHDVVLTMNYVNSASVAERTGNATIQNDSSVSGISVHTGLGVWYTNQAVPCTAACQYAPQNPSLNLSGKYAWVAFSVSLLTTGVASSLYATFTSTPTYLSVAFNSSVYYGTPKYVWDWKWGDSTTDGTVRNPTHVYAAAGTYAVELIVTDSSSPSQFYAVWSNLTLTAGTLAISMASSPGHVLFGGTERMWANVSLGTPNYMISYVGLPSGCSSANRSVDNCTSSVAGSFPVYAKVKDSAGATATSGTVVLRFLAWTISGFTVNKTSSSTVAIAWVHVSVSSTGLTNYTWFSSNSIGFYSFTALNGTYWINATASGYTMNMVVLHVTGANISKDLVLNATSGGGLISCGTCVSWLWLEVLGSVLAAFFLLLLFFFYRRKKKNEH